MSIVESSVITVYNYSDSFATLTTQIKPDGYLFEPALAEDQPFAIPISFSELRVANSQSNIFREGILRFEQEVEQEVYEKLGIRDWQEILSDKEIRDIILKPTKSGLDRIIKITSPSLLERVRGMLISLENSGSFDISLRVKDVVSRRHVELYNNQRKSDIEIMPTAAEQQQEVQDIDIDKIRAEAEAKIRQEYEEKIRAELQAEYETKIRAELQAEFDKKQQEQVKTDATSPTTSEKSNRGRPSNQK